MSSNVWMVDFGKIDVSFFHLRFACVGGDVQNLVVTLQGKQFLGILLDAEDP